jgi:uncharacterized membrane protein YagU involved in acid resistance
MDEFQSFISKIENQVSKTERSAKPSEDSEQEPATVKAGVAITERFLHHQLTGAEKQQAGIAMHYAMGAASGALYGALCEIFPPASAGAGALFGIVLWITADEIAVPALGLSKGPTEFPIGVHAKALASHLVYGVSTELIRRGLRKFLSILR